MTLREILNARKWQHKDLDKCVLYIAERNEKHELVGRAVPGFNIEGIGPAGIAVGSDDPDGWTYIPYHRILRVVGPGSFEYVRIIPPVV